MSLLSRKFIRNFCLGANSLIFSVSFKRSVEWKMSGLVQRLHPLSTIMYWKAFHIHFNIETAGLQPTSCRNAVVSMFSRAFFPLKKSLTMVLTMFIKICLRRQD